MWSRFLRFGMLSSQWIFLAAGVLLLGSQVWHQVHAEQVRTQVVSDFENTSLIHDALPDQSSWSQGRIAKWLAGQKVFRQKAIAVLYLPGSDTAIPVFKGVSDQILDIGAGHLESTPMPGTQGNFAVAAHRDGYFRVLKDIGGGDLIRVATKQGDISYRVTSTKVVEPTDISVLAQTSTATITLITCYPFYFVGSAPQRFIVQGTRIDANDPVQISAMSESQEGGSGD